MPRPGTEPTPQACLLAQAAVTYTKESRKLLLSKSLQLLHKENMLGVGAGVTQLSSLLANLQKY